MAKIKLPVFLPTREEPVSYPDPKICESCGQEMMLQKNFGAKKRGIAQRKYRIRRYHCELCEISHTVFANGVEDHHRVIEAINESKNNGL